MLAIDGDSQVYDTSNSHPSTYNISLSKHYFSSTFPFLNIVFLLLLLIILNWFSTKLYDILDSVTCLMRDFPKYITYTLKLWIIINLYVTFVTFLGKRIFLIILVILKPFINLNCYTLIYVPLFPPIPYMTIYIFLQSLITIVDLFGSFFLNPIHKFQTMFNNSSL